MTQSKNTGMRHILFGALLIVMVILLPWLTKNNWFSMIVKIREAITTGDTGPLIMASASNSILFTLQNTLSFIGIYSILSGLKEKLKVKEQLLMIFLVILFFIVNHTLSVLFIVPWEITTSLMACVITLLFITKSDGSHDSVFRASVISLQVFFAFQWLNVMPSLSNYLFGMTDIPSSIKLTSIYLESTHVMNFVGLAFFLPLFISAAITSVLFVSFDRNIRFAKENYEKEKDLDAIQAKALENRIYEEIHTLTHDLKTPLVTIRGLSSLLSISHDKSKISVYTERIDNAVEKMSEMITSFLYGTSRQLLSVEELVNYVRAQIPIENEELAVTIEMDDQLPRVYANKIRVVRALINIIENAMLIPTHNDMKTISINVTEVTTGIEFKIRDNGIGIQAEKMDKIWEVGYSTQNTSGLGLSFAKKVIEDNNGKITLESTFGVGTTVKIFLPNGEEQWGNQA